MAPLIKKHFSESKMTILGQAKAVTEHTLCILEPCAFAVRQDTPIHKPRDVAIDHNRFFSVYLSLSLSPLSSLSLSLPLIVSVPISPYLSLFPSAPLSASLSSLSPRSASLCLSSSFSLSLYIYISPPLFFQRLALSRLGSALLISPSRQPSYTGDAEVQRDPGSNFTYSASSLPRARARVQLVRVQRP